MANLTKFVTGDDNESKESCEQFSEELREKLSASLDTLDVLRNTIHSVNKGLSDLEKVDLEALLKNNPSNLKNEKVIIIPREEHEAFKERLKNLCTMRETLLKCKFVETLFSADLNSFEKSMKKVIELGGAEHARQLAECEELEKLVGITDSPS